ncbi:MAG: carboxymuconolactone decarboxylase family protein [Pseudomonadota bacterium]
MFALPTSTPKFDALYAHALTNDLGPLDSLNSEERFAVLLGGLASLSLSEQTLTSELRSLLDKGCNLQLAEDILIQMAVYLGAPAARQALASLAAAAEPASVLATREARPEPAAHRFEAGTAAYAELNPNALSDIQAAFGKVAPDVIDLTFRGFGDLYGQSSQPLTSRQLATVSALAVLGSAAPQLRFHIGAAFRVGVSCEKLVETIAWVQFLKGAPAAYNALTELKAALAAGNEATPGYE